MGKQQHTAKERLTQLMSEFAEWRAIRPRPARIPESLWQAAGALARVLGVNPVKESLGLNHSALRERATRSDMGSDVATMKVAKRFVELGGSDLFSPAMEKEATGPSLEISDGRGMQLKIRLCAGKEVDLASLVTALRGQR